MIYTYKKGLVLNNLPWSICYKIKPNQIKLNHIYLINMFKLDLALNYLQWLICHKTKPNQFYPFDATIYIQPCAYIHINYAYA